MSIKIKSCTKCRRSYNFEEWQWLELLATNEGDGAETRRCTCGQTEMIADIVFLHTLELRTPDEKRRAAAVMIRDERRRQRRERWRMPAAVVAGLLVVVVIAFILWGA